VRDDHQVIGLAIGRLALHYAEKNAHEVAALDDKAGG
jgi:hypothetical protein